jgi:RNA polymerase sigma factor (sigma-70 family)
MSLKSLPLEKGDLEGFEMRTEDGNIICQCLEGKPASFGLLVDKYKASILAIAYAELHNMQDAEEVAQDAFIQAYKKLNTLRRWDSFLSWICAITYNLCKRRLSSQSKRPDSEFIEDQEPEIIEKPSIDFYNMEKSNESIDDTIDIINKALDSLPKIYSQVLTLHYLGGMGVREMAQVLSISPDNIKQRLNRARAKLREEVLTMMNTTFEQQKLQASFTFNVVEMVKQIKIHTIPRIPLISWGFSVGVGLIFTVMSFFPNLVSNIPIGTHIGSPLPSESRVLKVGEIPVDVMKTAEMTFISNLSGKGKNGEPKVFDMQNAFFMSPQAEGGEWVKKANMPTARDSCSASVVSGRIYVIGGGDANFVSLKTVEEYDPVKDTWTKKADMPTARFTLSTSMINGKIYAIGGGKGVTCFSTVEIYDPVTDTWSKGMDMPTARRGLSTSVVNGKIYAIGGDNKFGPCLSTVEEYDPVKDEWTKKTDMPTARFGLSTSVVNDEIYAIGGIPVNVQAWNALSTVEVYNPKTDTWTKKSDMPTSRTNFSTCLMSKRIYAVGGALVQPSVVTSKVEVYDPATDTWDEEIDMQFARGWLSVSAVSGKIYAIGGSTDVDFLQTVEEYTPEDWSYIVSPQGKLPTTWGKKKQN